MGKDIKALAPFAALAMIAGPTVAQEVTNKIADSLPADHIITKYTTKVFMEKVKAELGERVAFEHYPAQQLAKAKDMLSITQAGIADIGYVVPSCVSEKMPLGGVVELRGRLHSLVRGRWRLKRLSSPVVVWMNWNSNPTEFGCCIT